ncbi:hypothetical protein LTR05_002204 [Lithohypha guttulata]|uniref:Uncharacterized protein n=1 Tax=Lithohypha guttulata TaxID=1690604 RepID=A0AAN7Y7K3_9EURO|nr:hypothetical protein LTR05_002204 [Lithohypha guttulata]
MAQPQEPEHELNETRGLANTAAVYSPVTETSATMHTDSKQSTQSVESSGATEAANPTETCDSDLSFLDALDQSRKKLDQESSQFEEDLQGRNTKNTDLEVLDWDDLLVEYEKEIAAIAHREKEIINKFDTRFKSSEEELIKQEQHYVRVMEAFQSAMSLLNHSNQQ